jgi:hypothetical protein
MAKQPMTEGHKTDGTRYFDFSASLLEGKIRISRTDVGAGNSHGVLEAVGAELFTRALRLGGR